MPAFTKKISYTIIFLIVFVIKKCAPLQHQRHFLSHVGQLFMSNSVSAAVKRHIGTTVCHTDKTIQSSPLLYLPGLDGGSGIFSDSALGCLCAEYACERLTVTASDRSTFLSLANKLNDHINKCSQPVVLVGESFGAVLAMYLAAKAPTKIAVLVLINPATSYAKSMWPVVGTMIAKSGQNYPMVSVGALLSTGVQPYQVLRLAALYIRQRNQSNNTLVEETQTLLDNIQQISKLLPADTLLWRLKQWLDVGGHLVDNKIIQRITAPTLILVGEEDRMLPSAEEGKRLAKRLTNAKVRVKTFPGLGHSILDGSVDLLQLIKNFTASDTVTATTDASKYSAVYPTEEAIRKAQPLVSALQRSTSPVFLSRAATGELQRGIHNVPTGALGRPVVLVSNHQLLGQDLPLVISEFLQEKQTLPRGLAHPLIFRDSKGRDRTSAMRDLFTTFGAVEISPMAYYQLLKANATILLYPGGAKEAFHKRSGKYKLFWPEKTDFVRMAATMDALIVPFAAIGMDDSLFVIADEDDYERIRGVAAIGRRLAARLPQARAGVVDTTLPPLVVPTLPARSYFLFQQAFDTRDIKASNKAECRAAYKQIEGSLADAIDTLLALQKRDPYRNFGRRIIYEALKKQQAPYTMLQHTGS